MKSPFIKKKMHSISRIQKSLKRLKTCILLSLCTFFTLTAFSQEEGSHSTFNAPPPSPIIIGSLMGHNGIHIETILAKTFTPNSRLGVFGIVDMYGVYKASEQEFRNQNMSQTHLTYRIVKGLNISAGAFFEKHSGFRPTLGLQYNLFLGDFHVLVAPRIDLSQTYNTEILAFVEYTPQLKDDWRLYLRAQGLYNRDLKNDIHAISYTWARMGVSYKTYTFGLGANLNAYGPMKMREQNFGLFVGALLF